MKYIGYFLLGLGGYLLAANGFGINTWQFWAISMCLIGGSNFSKG